MKLSWLFWTYWKSDLYGHLTPKRRVLWPSNTRSYSCKSAHSWLNNDDLRLKRLEIEPYMLCLWAGRKSQSRFRPWMDWGLGPLLSGEEEETGKSEFYCLPFFSNSILTPIVAQTMRSMIGIDKPLFSLPINIAINSNIRETEYKMIIALFFIIKLSVD